MLATMDDDSNHRRWYQSHGMVATHEVPAITYDDVNHTRNREARAMPATTGDAHCQQIMRCTIKNTQRHRPWTMSAITRDLSNHTLCQPPRVIPARCQQPHMISATTSDGSKNTRCQRPHMIQLINSMNNYLLP